MENLIDKMTAFEKNLAMFFHSKAHFSFQIADEIKKNLRNLVSDSQNKKQQN